MVCLPKAAQALNHSMGFTAFHRNMYGYAVWLSRNKTIAEDVVQESLLRAWRSPDSLREEDAAKSWLLTIVRRENARYFSRMRMETVDIDNLTAGQSAIIATTDDRRLGHRRCQAGDIRVGRHQSRAIGTTSSDRSPYEGNCRDYRHQPGGILTRLHRARMRLKANIGKDVAC